MHAALDDAAADVLDGGEEQPGEVAAEGIVGREPGMEPGRDEEGAELGDSKVSSTHERALCMTVR